MDRASISSLIKKIHKGTPGTGMKDDVKAVIRRTSGGTLKRAKGGNAGDIRHYSQLTQRAAFDRKTAFYPNFERKTPIFWIASSGV